MLTPYAEKLIRESEARESVRSSYCGEFSELQRLRKESQELAERLRNAVAACTALRNAGRTLLAWVDAQGLTEEAADAASGMRGLVGRRKHEVR